MEERVGVGPELFTRIWVDEICRKNLCCSVDVAGDGKAAQGIFCSFKGSLFSSDLDLGPHRQTPMINQNVSISPDGSQNELHASTIEDKLLPTSVCLFTPISTRTEVQQDAHHGELKRCQSGLLAGITMT